MFTVCGELIVSCRWGLFLHRATVSMVSRNRVYQQRLSATICILWESLANTQGQQCVKDIVSMLTLIHFKTTIGCNSWLMLEDDLFMEK